MVKQTGPNKYQFYLKILVVIGFLLLLVGTIYVIKYPTGTMLETKNLIAAVLFVFFMSFLIVLVFIQLYFLPFRVIINNDAKSIEVCFPLHKSEMLCLDDIEQYSTTTIYTRSTNYEGLLLYVKNGPKLLISDFNLQDSKVVLDILEESQIPRIGMEKFLFWRYYRQFL